MNNDQDITIIALRYPERVEQNKSFTINWSIQYSINIDKTYTLFTTMEDETGILMDREQTIPDFFHRMLYFVFKLFGINNKKHKGKIPYTYYEKGIQKNKQYTIKTGYNTTQKNHLVLFKKS